MPHTHDDLRSRCFPLLIAPQNDFGNSRNGHRMYLLLNSAPQMRVSHYLGYAHLFADLGRDSALLLLILACEGHPPQTNVVDLCFCSNFLEIESWVPVEVGCFDKTPRAVRYVY